VTVFRRGRHGGRDLRAYCLPMTWTESGRALIPHSIPECENISTPHLARITEYPLHSPGPDLHTLHHTHLIPEIDHFSKKNVFPHHFTRWSPRPPGRPRQDHPLPWPGFSPGLVTESPAVCESVNSERPHQPSQVWPRDRRVARKGRYGG